MNGKVKVLLIVIILSSLVLGCTTPAEKTVQSGDWVSVDYTGRYTNGTVFDTSNATIANASGIVNPGRIYEPIVFQVDKPGMIQGFNDAVIGMKVNETRLNVTIPPEKAYGEYNQSYVVTTQLKNANASDYKDYIGQGITFNGVDTKLVAIDVANNTMTLDYNNPMAGKTLVFDITVAAINPSPSPKA